MRRAARVDSNQAEIVKAFRKLGCSVLSMAALGKGAPDLLIGWGGICIAVEVKDGSKPPSARELTEDQRDFWETWRGGVRLVPDLEAVVETVNLLKRWHARLTT